MRRHSSSNTQDRDKGHLTILDQTLAKLRADITTGVLPPNTKLRLDDLKARYGVGGSPLREALSRLVGAGLIKAEPQRGFYIPDASHEDLLDITRLRQLIEAEALTLSMAHGDEIWESEILAAFHRFERRTRRGDHRKVETLTLWEEAHRDFHKSLVSACGSRRLIHIQEDLYDQALRYRALVVGYDFDPRDLIAEHRLLMDTIISGDRQKAVAALQRHLALTREIVCCRERASDLKFRTQNKQPNDNEK